VAVFLRFVPAFFNWVVDTFEPLLHLADRPERLLLALIANFPRLFLAILRVAVFLGLLWACLHLQLADLLRFEVTILFFYWEREDIGELLAIPVDIGLANLDLNLSWNVVTILGGLSCANNSLRTVTIILGAFVTLTVEFYRIRTSYVVDDLLLHVAIRRLHICALIIILGCHVDLVGCIANSIFTGETPLNLIGLFQRF